VGVQFTEKGGGGKKTHNINKLVKLKKTDKLGKLSGSKGYRATTTQPRMAKKQKNSCF